jgi:hypothetical protein
MPGAPGLPITITAGAGGHISNTNTVHTVVNAIYLASIGTTQVSSFTLLQGNSGEIIPVNSGSAVAVTVPVLSQGSNVELLRQGTGTVTLSASGVTFTQPIGSVASARVQGSTISLLWLTTASVLLGGDLS